MVTWNACYVCCRCSNDLKFGESTGSTSKSLLFIGPPSCRRSYKITYHTISLGMCSQNDKFAISLQYLKKEVCDKVDFLVADKHKSFLQIDTMISDGDGQAFPKSPKYQVCNNCTISQKRKLIFYIQIIIKVSYKLISTLLGINVFSRVILALLIGMIKHSQSTESNKLQYLYIITKKKLAIKLFNKNIINKVLHVY